MSGDQQSYLAAIEQEEARLRDRLAKLAKFKELALELGITPEIGTLSAAPAPVIAAPQTATHPSKFVTASLAMTRTVPAAFMSSAPAVSESVFDGTFAGLIDTYRTHEASPYHKLKHKVRSSYDYMLNRIKKDVGGERIADWSADKVQSIYDDTWAAGGKVSMGHTLIGKLRLLTSFGSVVLNDNACTRLSTILGNMRFPLGEKRTEVLTFDHARAIRAAANNEFNWPSIALAQAFQFELSKLRQVDVIGEWVPISEPGTSDITKGHEKWMNGLRWSDIDDGMILRRTVTSGRKNQQKVVEFDLKHYAMIMEEINRVPPWNRNGPIIICEYSNLPWSAAEFRRKWRLVADKAGVPTSLTFTDGGRGYTVDPSSKDPKESGTKASIFE
jgi:hypothetical protein